MKGILFDFDGVLGNTMHRHAEAYKAVLAKRGIEIELSEVLELEGGRSESVIRNLLQNQGREVTDAEIAEISKLKQVEYMAKGAPSLYPLAKEAIAAAKKLGYGIGVVTGTKRENLEKILGPLVKQIDTLQSQETYENDKPHPEPYANGCKALRLDPIDVVVVENAVLGIQSAHAAGVGLIIGITTTMPALRLREAGADLIVSNHEALIRNIEALAIEE